MEKSKVKSRYSDSAYREIARDKATLKLIISEAKNWNQLAKTLYGRKVGTSEKASILFIFFLLDLELPSHLVDTQPDFTRYLKVYDSDKEARNSANYFTMALIPSEVKYECEECGDSEKRGNWIRLQVDHRRGNPRDSRLENLRFLCGTCHDLQPTSSSSKLVNYVNSFRDSGETKGDEFADEKAMTSKSQIIHKAAAKPGRSGKSSTGETRHPKVANNSPDKKILVVVKTKKGVRRVKTL